MRDKETPKFKGYKKADRYYWYTIDLLKDRLTAKRSRQAIAKAKVDAYEKEIHEMEAELTRRIQNTNSHER